MTEIERARRIAQLVHTNTDLSDLPVIDHVARVAAAVQAAGGDDEQIAAAWLHDVLEDSDLTSADLIAEGISLGTVLLVEALTRNHHGPETYRQFVQRAADYPPARLVKLCDLRDNLTRALPSDPEVAKAYAGMRIKRYEPALALLNTLMEVK